MKEEIIKQLLGDLELSFLIAFYIFAILGAILSMLLHLGKAVKKHKIKFSFMFWLRDNATRLLTSIIVLFIAARFYTELGLAFELNLFSGFVAGTAMDRIIIVVRNRTGINAFQKK